MTLKRYYILLVVLFSVLNQSFAQDDGNLDRLDSLAFDALENSKEDVGERANQLLEASRKVPASKHLVNAYTILGIINKDKGYYVTSLNNYLKALNAAELIKDTGRISACYNNIGTVYQLQENYVRARDYFLKSLRLEEKLEQPLQKSIRYYNIGEIYKELDSLDLALNYFTNSLIIEQKFNNADGIIYALLGISDVYMRIERYTDAELALEKVKKLLKDIYLEETILYHQLKGKLFKARSQLDEALGELLSAEKLSLKHNFRIHLLDIYATEIEIFITNEQWKAAVEKQQAYIELKTELNDIRVKNQLEDLSFQNELNKKELEIALIQEERDLAQQNEAAVSEIARYTRKIVFFLITSLVVVIGLVVYGIRKITRDNAA